MGWETRGGRGKYYTRSKRDGERVIREYAGSGVEAEIAARQDQVKREQRRLEAAAWQNEQHDYLTAEAEVTAFSEDLSRTIQLVLLAEGYHQHDRGAWRMRRG